MQNSKEYEKPLYIIRSNLGFFISVTRDRAGEAKAKKRPFPLQFLVHLTVRIPRWPLVRNEEGT